ncbi:hypothetical protein PF008_g21881 [Phytophthora fragariae]|uniref:Uncharacterized protein n=2 Tax=Phytophthora fragariae TaxID=53985 RepID=A0A6G0QW08_9STRA|nr:hypothetical protein PF008_g21881 [Phytophthora fragariae]
MAARFSPQDVVMEPEAKRRLGPHVQRRGDGFTEAESMGLLQLVRSHWREGWDVVAQLHNQQFAKHNRSADSLKKKFSRLYRSSVPPRGAKNHQAITFAHVVHKEMVEGVPPAPGMAVPSVDGESVDAGDAAFQPPQSDERMQDGATESEHSWVDTASEVPAGDTMTAPSPSSAPIATPAVTASPAAIAAAVAAAAPRPRVRAPRSQSVEWQSAANAFPLDASPLPTDDLLTSVLKVILRSQYQRDLDREEERTRRDEERQRRREEAEQRRQEEERRRDEEREERRRRSEERTEERAENRRRHEQFMQMMMMLVGKNGANEQRDTEC